MPNKYNLYRVEASRYASLVKSLEDAGFSKTDASAQTRGFTLDFYLGHDAPRTPRWLGLYRAFLPPETVLRNQMHSAALVIHNEQHCYVAAIGRAFHPIQKVCDREFGLNLAERIANPEEVKQKASRFFQSQRRKSIQSFLRNNPFSYDSGESVTYMKARTLDAKLWGERAEFGVSFRFHSHLDPGRLVELVEIIIGKLQGKGNFAFPRTEVVKDVALRTTLDQILAGQILSDQDGASGHVAVDDFQLQGCDFVFYNALDFQAFVYGQMKATLTPLPNRSLADLRAFIADQSLDEAELLRQVRIQVVRDEGSKLKFKLAGILDIVVEQGNKSYCLISGEWVKFSRSYLDFLNEQIAALEHENAHLYDFIEGKGEPNRKGQKGAAGRDEEWFIAQVRKHDPSYESYHNTDFARNFKAKMLRHKVELMDLLREKTLYVVKRGKTQKLGYALDQAIATVNLLKDLRFKLKLPWEKARRTKTIRPKVITVWLVVTRKAPIAQLSELNSTILKMKLLEFNRVARDAGLQPQIRFSYEIAPRHQKNYPLAQSVIERS
ncbi:MAG: DUF6119 family protein [Bacteroidota bacterium]